MLPALPHAYTESLKPIFDQIYWVLKVLEIILRFCGLCFHHMNHAKDAADPSAGSLHGVAALVVFLNVFVVLLASVSPGLSVQLISFLNFAISRCCSISSSAHRCNKACT